VTDRQSEGTPGTVPERASRAGDAKARNRWGFVEPSVWTERMLAALDRGVKGGRWYSLMDKVRAEGNLRAAFARVKANGGSAGADHQTTEMFGARLEENLEQLRQELESGTYRPRPARRVWIPKPGRNATADEKWPPQRWSDRPPGGRTRSKQFQRAGGVTRLPGAARGARRLPGAAPTGVLALEASSGRLATSEMFFPVMRS
jgi:hypothetical protein